MQTAVLNKLAAIDLLTNGNGVYHKTIMLTNVSWQEYERYLKAYQEKTGWRLAYDEGYLEFMPPLTEHERPSRQTHDLVRAYCDYFDINMESAGSTTYKRKLLKKGVEPDECFYIESVDKIIGKAKKLDPNNYPVPDVAVEIDVTHGSLDKFKIYAGLGVPELWLYDGKNVRIYQLAGKKYNQKEISRAFPLLTAKVLTEFLKLSETEGQTAALKAFRQWLQREPKS